MWDFILSILRDDVWQFLFGLIGIVVAILLFVAERQRKELSFFSTWTIGEFVLEGGCNKPVPTRQFVVKVINTGKISILPSDFQRPIALYVPDCRILNALATDTNPPNIHPQMSVVESGEIVLSPTLLNPGDSITLKITSTFAKFSTSVYLDCRIAGVKRIRRMDLRHICITLMRGFLGLVLAFSPYPVAEWLKKSGQTDALAILENYTIHIILLGGTLSLVAVYGSSWMRTELAATVRIFKTIRYFANLFGSTIIPTQRRSTNQSENGQSEHNATS
jgi:hypothetical protein